MIEGKIPGSPVRGHYAKVLIAAFNAGLAADFEVFLIAVS
jgi:hypothetical protein